MAENQRTQVKAAIKRASVQAREGANKIDRAALDELTRLYRESAFSLADVIASYSDEDGSIKVDVLQELLDQVNERLQVLAGARDRLLADKMTETALLAASAFSADASQMGISLTQVAHDAVMQARAFVDANGLQLSDRIWRNDNQARQSVADAIQLNVIQGHSAAQAALDYISTGKAIPSDLQKKKQTAGAMKIARDASNALLSQDGSAYKNALRVFRTEINRAHGLAYQSAAYRHPDSVGTRFLLSPNHPQVDICDMHAKVNRYGLGPGVYPPGKSPWPAHPNTLSYEEIVFADEVSEADKQGKTNRIDYLKSLNPARQNAILGRYKGWMLREGHLTENTINSPWAILKARLEKQGIVIPTFRIEGPLVQVPSVSDRIAPVSDAFDVLEFKHVSRHVLDTIDSVHSDGALPIIPIKRTTAQESREAYGMYRRTIPQAGDNAVSISLNRQSPHLEFTLAHEIGHFIDHKGLPGSYMSSEYHDVMEKWRKAVFSSPEIKWLEQLQAGSSAVVIDGNVHEVPKNYISYLLRKREIWARTYSQWVAMKSGDPTLMSQLKAEINKSTKKVLPIPGQWKEEHFKPIAEAIEDLFKQMGWL